MNTRLLTGILSWSRLPSGISCGESGLVCGKQTDCTQPGKADLLARGVPGVLCRPGLQDQLATASGRGRCGDDVDTASRADRRLRGLDGNLPRVPLGSALRGCSPKLAAASGLRAD